MGAVFSQYCDKASLDIFWLRDESLEESDARAVRKPSVQAVRQVPTVQLVKVFETQKIVPIPAFSPRNRRRPRTRARTIP